MRSLNIKPRKIVTEGQVLYAQIQVACKSEVRQGKRAMFPNEKGKLVSGICIYQADKRAMDVLDETLILYTGLNKPEFFNALRTATGASEVGKFLVSLEIIKVQAIA